nr:MAG TPA: hypothetical protein [Caudoviricetes sp.]
MNLEPIKETNKSSLPAIGKPFYVDFIKLNA